MSLADIFRQQTAQTMSQMQPQQRPPARIIPSQPAQGGRMRGSGGLRTTNKLDAATFNQYMIDWGREFRRLKEKNPGMSNAEIYKMIGPPPSQVRNMSDIANYAGSIHKTPAEEKKELLKMQYEQDLKVMDKKAALQRLAMNTQQQFQAEQARLGRDWQARESQLGRESTAEREQLRRDWQTEQNQLDRKAKEDEANRQYELNKTLIDKQVKKLGLEISQLENPAKVGLSGVYDEYSTLMDNRASRISAFATKLIAANPKLTTAAAKAQAEQLYQDDIKKLIEARLSLMVIDDKIDESKKQQALVALGLAKEEPKDDVQEPKTPPVPPADEPEPEANAEAKTQEPKKASSELDKAIAGVKTKRGEKVAIGEIESDERVRGIKAKVAPWIQAEIDEIAEEVVNSGNNSYTLNGKTYTKAQVNNAIRYAKNRMDISIEENPSGRTVSSVTRTFSRYFKDELRSYN